MNAGTVSFNAAWWSSGLAASVASNADDSVACAVHGVWGEIPSEICVGNARFVASFPTTPQSQMTTAKTPPAAAYRYAQQFFSCQWSHSSSVCLILFSHTQWKESVRKAMSYQDW
jgi:hypothetical protein